MRKRQGGEDRIEIRLAEVLEDVRHDMGARPGLEKDGVERDLQHELAAQPHALEDEPGLVRREWPTDIGPVDLMCRDSDDQWVAVEIKRIATMEAVEQLSRYLERIRLDPAMAGCRGILAAQKIRPQVATMADARWVRLRRGRPRVAPRREPELTPSRLREPAQNVDVPSRPIRHRCSASSKKRAACWRLGSLSKHLAGQLRQQVEQRVNVPRLVEDV